MTQSSARRMTASHEDTADMGPGMINMLGMMPGMMRMMMMKGRINALFAYTEERREQAIRRMFLAFHHPKVSRKAREKVIRTRVEIVAGLPPARRTTIMKSRTEAMKLHPEVEQRDVAIQEKLLSKIHPKLREAFEDTWKTVRGDC